MKSCFIWVCFLAETRISCSWNFYCSLFLAFIMNYFFLPVLYPVIFFFLSFLSHTLFSLQTFPAKPFLSMPYLAGCPCPAVRLLTRSNITAFLGWNLCPLDQINSTFCFHFPETFHITFQENVHEIQMFEFLFVWKINVFILCSDLNV